jgi:hypothetical protein
MKKTTVSIAAICAMTTVSLYAGSGPYYVFAFSGSKSTAVSLEKDADYVSMSLTVQSNQKEPNARFAEIKQAQNLILGKAKNQDGIIIHKGPISLSPKPMSKFSSISSFSYSHSSSTAQLHVMAKLDDRSDVYACASQIRRFLDSIKMPGKSHHSLGQIQLAIANPEQYRQEILTRISKDVEFVKSTVQTSGKVTITGLEQPVLVRQVDDRKVELFINYSMTMELSNQAIDSDKE